MKRTTGKKDPALQKFFRAADAIVSEENPGRSVAAIYLTMADQQNNKFTVYLTPDGPPEGIIVDSPPA